MSDNGNSKSYLAKYFRSRKDGQFDSGPLTRIYIFAAKDDEMARELAKSFGEHKTETGFTEYSLHDLRKISEPLIEDAGNLRTKDRFREVDFSTF